MVNIVDYSREFHTKTFIEACERKGITIQYVTPSMPYEKSNMERWHRMNNSKFASFNADPALIKPKFKGD